MTTDSVVGNIFIATASLRSSSAALMGQVNKLVVQRVRYTAERSGPLQDRVAFWRPLEVMPALVDDSAEADLVWNGINPLVNQSWQDVISSLDCVAAMVLSTLQCFFR